MQFFSKQARQDKVFGDTLNIEVYFAEKNFWNAVDSLFHEFLFQITFQTKTHSPCNSFWLVTTVL